MIKPQRDQLEIPAWKKSISYAGCPGQQKYAIFYNFSRKKNTSTWNDAGWATHGLWSNISLIHRLKIVNFQRFQFWFIIYEVFPRTEIIQYVLLSLLSLSTGITFRSYLWCHLMFSSRKAKETELWRVSYESLWVYGHPYLIIFKRSRVWICIWHFFVIF